MRRHPGARMTHITPLDSRTMGKKETPDIGRREIAPADEASRESTVAKLAAALRRTDEKPRLLVAAKLARELLPGDSGYGDPLSTSGKNPSQQLGRRLSALTAERPH